MTYLLIAVLTGVISWPYYFRFTGFQLKIPPIVLALLVSAPIAVGAALMAYHIQVHGSNPGLLQFDFVTAMTYWIIALFAAGFNVWLMFTAESCPNVDEIEEAFALLVITLVISLAIGMSASFSIIKLVQVLS